MHVLGEVWEVDHSLVGDLRVIWEPGNVVRGFTASTLGHVVLCQQWPTVPCCTAQGSKKEANRAEWSFKRKKVLLVECTIVCMYAHSNLTRRKDSFHLP